MREECFVIISELLLHKVIESFQSRLYDKFLLRKVNVENLQTFKSILVINGYNYSYLYNAFINPTESYRENCVEFIEKDLLEILDKYFE